MAGCIRWLIFLMLVVLVAPAQGDDWPQWMGPKRDAVWHEQGIVDKLPADGPTRLWTAKVELGYAGPAVCAGKVYVPDYLRTEGDITPSPIKRNVLAGKERIHCLNAKTGEVEWTHEYPCKYEVSYPSGPRCTPTINDGRVYCLGTMGHLLCLHATSGKLLWEKDIPEECDARVPIWGYAGHPLIYKDLLICLVGAKDGLLMAFDKQTGKKVWSALSEEHPGYCPPSIIQRDGKPELVIATPSAIYGLDPDTGEERWEVPFHPQYGMSIAAPLLSGKFLFTGSYGDCVAVQFTGKKPEEVWRGKRYTGLYPSNATPIIHQGIIYGVDATGLLRAVKLDTGHRLWESGAPVIGQPARTLQHGTAFIVRHAGATQPNRYFLFNEHGDLIDATLTPSSYTEHARVRLLSPTGHAFGRAVVWTHPAFAEKCIFVRNDNEIACYSLAGK